MFEKWKEKRIIKKVAKLKRYPVFHYPLDEANYEIGTYRTGRLRPFDILCEVNMKEKFTLTDVIIRLNDQQELLITGTKKEDGTPFEKVFQKVDIKWHDFLHLYNIGLDERLDLCADPNGGTLDISLTNGDSLLLHYTFDMTKKHRLVVGS